MTGTLDLGDGRVLGYRSYGASAGHVVVNCHGGLVCGLDVAPFDTTARHLGLRIVSPDRPGLGRSSPARGRTTGDLDRRFTLLARHHPHVASATFRELGRIARHTPAAWAHLTLRAAQPGEASTLEALPDPGIASAAAAALEGGDGMVEEYRAWVRPWGFAPADIPGPVTFFHGDADDLVPPAWSATLADAVPRGRLERVPGAGHFLGYTHTADVLRSLIG